jgi:hypothetical protein
MLQQLYMQPNSATPTAFLRRGHLQSLPLIKCMWHPPDEGKSVLVTPNRLSGAREM